jgi:hypothetical protein
MTNDIQVKTADKVYKIAGYPTGYFLELVTIDLTGK